VATEGVGASPQVDKAAGRYNKKARRLVQSGCEGIRQRRERFFISISVS